MSSVFLRNMIGVNTVNIMKVVTISMMSMTITVLRPDD